jgi:hypothetical protein
MTRGRARAAGVAGVGWGALLLADAERFAGSAPAAVALVRVLAARYLVQGVLLTVSGRPPVRIVRVVDVLHALSMFTLAGSRRYRRPALISAGVALGLAALRSRFEFLVLNDISRQGEGDAAISEAQARSRSRGDRGARRPVRVVAGS